MVVMLIDPHDGRAGPILFFASFFLALWGLCALIGLQARRPLREHDALIHKFVVRAFRQGALLSALVVASLALSVHGWLHWWIIAVMVVAVAAWEFFFLSGEQPLTTVS